MDDSALRKWVQMAFITNFTSPTTLDELIERYETFSGLTNIDLILRWHEFEGEWTVDKDATIGDTVFFMCAVTSTDARHMGGVVKEARELGNPEILAYAQEELELYKRFAGHIVAIGKVIDEPYRADSGFEHPHWRSPWYAEIGDFHLLRNPVSIDRYRDFIKVSGTGAITQLDDAQTARLLDLVAFENLA